MKHALALAALLVLFACATPTAYGPAPRPGAPGYAETRIEADRYRVTFVARGGPPERAYDLALRRAAELTLQSGYDWFLVNQRYGERAGSGAGPRVSLGVGGTSFGGHSATGVGAGVGFNLGGGPPASATLEFRMGRGAKPADAAAYDAREVARALGAPA
ncbi:MAG: hypothetical protein AB7M12_09090 [Hyphomonadaceae bacterium]